MNRVPLLDLINEKTNGKFSNYRLKSMKYMPETNVCQISFTYRKTDAIENQRDIEPFALEILPTDVRYDFLYARVTDEWDLVERFLRQYFESSYSIVFEQDGDIAYLENGDRREISLTMPTRDYKFTSDISICEKLEEALDEEFCASYSVTTHERVVKENLHEVAGSLLEDMRDNLAPELNGVRLIEPFHVEKYIGDIVTEPAIYIADAKSDADAKVVLCGNISRLTISSFPKKDNPEKIVNIVRFTLSDFTGSINCMSFISAANMPKYENLEKESAVVLLGTVSDGFRGGLEYKFSRLSYCEIPPDMKEVVIKKSTPKKYLILFPEPYVIEQQANLFDSGSVVKIDPYFIGKQFVVLDTETTGLDKINDRIIEIACVKIIDGKIESSMSSLINPQKPIPEGASDVNGITDDMVADAPIWEDVVGDLYRYCDGCTLVAHNADYDISMINNTAKQTHYYFDNEVIDTLALAYKKVKGMRNYKLGTLLKYFGLVNEEAHRALTDTIATAQLFIAMINMKE